MHIFHTRRSAGAMESTRTLHAPRGVGAAGRWSRILLAPLERRHLRAAAPLVDRARTARQRTATWSLDDRRPTAKREGWRSRRTSRVALAALPLRQAGRHKPHAAAC